MRNVTQAQLLAGRRAARERESNEAVVRDNIAIATFDELETLREGSCDIHHTFKRFLDRKISDADKEHGRNHAICGMVVETEDGEKYKYSFKSTKRTIPGVDAGVRADGTCFGEMMVDTEMLDTHHTRVPDLKTTSHCKDTTKLMNEDKWIRSNRSDFAADHHHTEQVVVNIFAHNMRRLAQAIASDKIIKNVTFHMYTVTAPSDEDIKAFMNLRQVIADRYGIDAEAIRVCVSFDEDYIKYHTKSVATIMAEEHDDKLLEEEGEDVPDLDMTKAVHVVRAPSVAAALSAEEGARLGAERMAFQLKKGSVMRRKKWYNLGKGIVDTSQLQGDSEKVVFTFYNVALGKGEFLPVSRKLDLSIEHLALNKPEAERGVSEADLLAGLSAAMSRPGSRGLAAPSERDIRQYYYRDNNIVAFINAVIAARGGYEAAGGAFLAAAAGDGRRIAVLSPADISAASRSPIHISINDDFKGRLIALMAPGAAQEEHIQILIPVSEGLSHWFSIEINIDRQADGSYGFTFTMHDPLIKGADVLAAKGEGIRQQLEACFGGILADNQHINYVSRNTPLRQRDGYSCGVITARDIEALINGNALLPYEGLTIAAFNAAILGHRTDDRNNGFVTNQEITGADIGAFFPSRRNRGETAPKIDATLVAKMIEAPMDLKILFANQHSRYMSEYKHRIVLKFMSLRDNPAVSALYKEFFLGEIPVVPGGMHDAEVIKDVIARVPYKDNVVDTMREIGLQAVAEQECIRVDRRERGAAAGILHRIFRRAIGRREAREEEGRREAASKALAEEAAQREAEEKAAEDLERQRAAHEEQRRIERDERMAKQAALVFGVDDAHRHVEASRAARVAGSPKRRRMGQQEGGAVYRAGGSEEASARI